MFCRLLFFSALLIGFSAHAADPNKVIRFAFPSAETKFDPGAESDQVSLSICENIFDSLLQYDYLARPVFKLVPNTAAAMPEVLDEGASYVIRIRKGIFFTPDPAFNGKPRELIAADYVYSLKRLLDPAVRSRWFFLLEGKLLGGDEWVERAKKTGKFDYDAALPGLEAIDRYTLRIRLKQPDYNLLYILAMPATGGMAREVVEFYGTDIGGHPVGTGPYMLAEWRRSSKIVLVANPDFHEEYLDTRYVGDDPMDKKIVRDIAGKRLPLAGRIEAYIIEEEQPRWLAFLNNEHDYVNPIPRDFAGLAVPGNKVASGLAKRGIRLILDEQLYVRYVFFNMNDPVIGGYGPEKIALRRAMAIAYDQDAEIGLLRNHQAVAAESPIPPGATGYDPNFRNPFNEFNPAKAKALLDMFGYVDRDGDGYREMPDGTTLSIEWASPPSLFYRQLDELWIKCMHAIGIRLTIRKAPLPELREAARLGKIQMMDYGWIGDYPDGENFFQLFSSKSIGQANYAQFSLPAYDRLYEKARLMPDSPARTALYNELTKLIIVYGPWRIGVYPRENHLVQPWVTGYKKHPMLQTTWRFLDVDLELKKRCLGNTNKCV